MTKQNIRIFLAFSLIVLQILFNLFLNQLHINIDFIFLILLYYILSRRNFIQAMLVATIVGWSTDLLTSHIVGLFGFSRVVIAFAIYEIIVFIDFKRLSFTFAFVFLSLALSNLIASFFLLVIHGYPLSAGLILHQPVLTGMFAVLLISSDRVKEAVNVY